MIRKVTVENFKRFDQLSFDLSGHIVLAGPNNVGKTSVLQAIAAWQFAFNQWRTLNDFHRHGGKHARKPVTRQTFYAVPLTSFDLLWKERVYEGAIRITLESDEGWALTMELLKDSTEQIYVRPLPQDFLSAEALRDLRVEIAFVPPMSGLRVDEPVYTRPYLEMRLGESRPGEVLRNLLLEAHGAGESWLRIQSSIKALFGYELSPPNGAGALITAEYRMRSGGPTFDIASAGSGFQQVLMLLTFLNARPASLLLVDEPDAHLHIILQDSIYGELRRVADRQRSQLIIATHSEVIIDSVDFRNLLVMLDRPLRITTEAQRGALQEGLKVLSNTDIMLASGTPGILYVEGHTDLDILREWARILEHPLFDILETKLFWKPLTTELRIGGDGIGAREHYAALQLVRADLPGVMLLDRDNNPNLTETAITGSGLQRLRWSRYEIESYLLHPDVIARFVEKSIGVGAAQEHIQDLQAHFLANYPPAFHENLFGDYAYLNGTKARTDLIPPALTSAGLPGIDYTRYWEIAAVMRPEEIHPEIPEKMNLIMRSFGL